MIDLKFLKDSWFFHEKWLEKWEILFDEWDIDDNIYIVLAWEFTVEKYTTVKKNETKVLAHLKKDDIFGEAALNSSEPKYASIKAKRKSLVIYINAKEWLADFSKKYPEEWMELLKYIIYLSNQRLNNSNFLITANYKISQEIIKLEEINNKSIFWLLDKIEDIIHVNHILFLEKNPVMENYLTIKYDSRKKWKMLSEIIEITDNKLELLELKLSDFNHYKQELSIWDDSLWFLIYFRKWIDFSDNDKKILTSISTWISWIIKEKILIEEQRDKEYMEN